jgi:hypothetical protein
MMQGSTTRTASVVPTSLACMTTVLVFLTQVEYKKLTSEVITDKMLHGPMPVAVPSKS